MIELNQIIHDDAVQGLKKLPDEYIDCIVTSPPYFQLRDYKIKGQIGLEDTIEEYVDRIIAVFCEIKRVLKKNGTVWINLGDSYNGSGKGYGQKPERKNCGKIKQKRGYDVPKPTKIQGLKRKDIIGVPWMVAFALRDDGWYLRQDIIWAKKNCMPESVTDRCVKSHEYIFLLSKSAKYYFDYKAIQEEAEYDGRKDICMKRSIKYENSRQNTRCKRKYDDTNMGGAGTGLHDHSGYNNLKNPYIRNKRSVWTVATQSFKEAHFAVYPEKLIEPCIIAGCPEGGIVLDPFIGSGTTGLVALKCNRNFIGIELNPTYIEIANKRIEPYLIQGKLF